MLVDGDLDYEIDLAAQLTELRYNEFGVIMGRLLKKGRREGFWEWKRGTLRRREAHGHRRTREKGVIDVSSDCPIRKFIRRQCVN